MRPAHPGDVLAKKTYTKRILILGGLLAVLALLWFLTPLRDLSLEDLFNNRDRLIGLIRDNYLPAVLIFIGLYIVVVAFSAAYMAEVVRGGLQAIPKGQYEAADALGLSYWKSMYLIILPQALKIVIPGIVNSFIGLFKDTTLVLIIGLFDILGMARAAITDSNWIGLAREAFVFVGVVYFIFCFAMSRYSLSLEKRLQTGHR